MKRAEEAAAKAQPDDKEEEEETEKDQLERETRELAGQLKKVERQEALSRDKEEREQAKRYSKWIQGGAFLKQPKAVTLVATRKRKKTLEMENIKSTDEEDEQDTIPEGFHLQEESPHCLNTECMEDYQAYLRQLVLEFERLLKTGGANMKDTYGKIIQSMFWACKVNKQTIMNGVEPEEVLWSIPDPKCCAWKLKFSGKVAVDPTSLVNDLPIGPQTTSEIVSMKPQEVMELVEEELVRQSPKQLNAIKTTIANICRSQALAHRHVADAADHMASLTDMVSLPIVMKVINATMRPTVALKIPEVDEMLERAQEKVDKIRKAKEAAGGIKPIDEVIFAQNVPQWNPEWEHS